MAMTDDERRWLREQIQEPVSVEWPNDRLDDFYNNNGQTVNGAAAAVWRVKANAAAGLSDITEDGSTRRLSTLAGQLEKVAQYYEAQAAETAPVASQRRVRVRQIERP